jgi:hypothetical protein
VDALVEAEQHLGVEARPAGRQPDAPDHPTQSALRLEHLARQRLTLILFEFGDFPMTRKLLLGIKRRAEHLVKDADRARSGVVPE